MLTERQNLLEVVKGGKPERFANNWIAFKETFTPAFMHHLPQPGQENYVNEWGVTISWRSDQPGAFPVHTPERIVVQDFEDWKDVVKAPSVVYPEAEWEPWIAAAEAVDREQQFVMAVMAPGIFEQTHYLGEISNACMAFYENPDELKELIKYIGEYELKLAEQIVEHLHPDALLHHDDWGTNISTFVAPEMFAEFFVDTYKEIYRYWHDHGVELIIHHSDSYGATLVPYMIEMGIDIWQGALPNNDIPSLIEQYGKDITIMGDIESSKIDIPAWTPELVREEVRRAMDECGPLHFIPCTTQGAPLSNFEGVLDCAVAEVAAYNDECFKRWQG